MGINETIDNLLLELRRGTLVLAVLNQLKQEQYGYSLINSLHENGLEIDQGTLYPLLRRLESQNLLHSDWRIESGRPRRYYVCSQEGLDFLIRLTKEWNHIVSLMDKILN
jgi:PadR family transcriptional regulator, regulatory protein PadR